MAEYGWSLKRADWTAARALVVEHDFGKVRMQLQMQGAVPSVSGVYVICCGPNDPQPSELWSELYNALYVGQAKNLRDRFVQHINARSGGAARVREAFDQLEFWYVPVPAATLSQYERTLQRALGPTANLISAPSYTVGLGPPVPANP